MCRYCGGTYPLNPISFVSFFFFLFSRPHCCAFFSMSLFLASQDMQYQEQKRAMESGMPAFQIYVRTKLNNMW